MSQVPLLILLLTPSTIGAVTLAQTQTLNVLQADAASSYASATDPLTARSGASTLFDNTSALPVTVAAISPVAYVSLEGTEVALDPAVQAEQNRLARERGQATADAPTTPADGSSPSYSFEGRRIPNLNVVTYTARANTPGENGPTQPPRRGIDWMAMLPKILLYGGIAATLIGIFLWPPALFIGGAALGGWGVLKLLGSRGG